MKKAVLSVILFILVITVAGCGFWMTRYFMEGKEQRDRFVELAEAVTVRESTRSTPKPNIVDRWFGFLRPEESVEAGKKNTVSHDLEALKAQNEDCVGWLMVSGADIDYPVMWAPEEPEKYLHLNFQGEYSEYGVPYLDARCGPDSTNLILYGQNMFDGSMFTPLIHFDQEDLGRTIRLELSGEVREYEVIAVAHTTSKSPIYQYTDFGNVYGTAAFLTALKSECPNTADVQAEEGMKFVTLSTHEASRGDGRTMVVAVRKEKQNL